MQFFPNFQLIFRTTSAIQVDKSNRRSLVEQKHFLLHLFIPKEYLVFIKNSYQDLIKKCEKANYKYQLLNPLLLDRKRQNKTTCVFKVCIEIWVTHLLQLRLFLQSNQQVKRQHELEDKAQERELILERLTSLRMKVFSKNKDQTNLLVNLQSLHGKQIKNIF